MKNKIYKFLSIPMIIFTFWACTKEIEPIAASANEITITPTGDLTLNSSVNFKAEAVNASSVKWEFILNGTVIESTSELSPTRKFSAVGNYTVIFKAIGSGGSVGKKSTFKIISPNPIVTFTVTGGDCVASCDVNFSAFPATGIAEYYWKWGYDSKETKTSSASTTHTFTRESPVDGFSVELFVKYKNTDADYTFISSQFVKIKPAPIIPSKVTHAWSAGGINSEEGRKIITDPSGNVYVAGKYIGGLISFGRDANNNEITLPFVAYWNNFIAKYTNTGVIIWAKTYRTEMGFYNSSSSSAGLISDLVFANNSLYVSFKNTHNNSLAEPQAGIIKVDIQNGIGSGIDLAYPRNASTILTYESLAVDNAGNIYIGGSFNNSLAGKYYDDLSIRGFVLKYNSSITYLNDIRFVSEKDSPNNTSSIVYDIAIAKDNTLYLMGNFTGKYGTAPYDISAIGKNTFLSKFDANFKIQWVRQDGTTNTTNTYTSFPRGLILDNDDNIFMLGSIENGNAISFGSRTLSNRSGATFRDNYLLKYDKNGTVLFLDYASKANHGVDAIAKDAKGDIITAGFRCNISKFNSIGTSIYQDVFLTTTLDNSAISITSDSNNNIFLTGYYNRTLNTIADVKTLPVKGNLDMMVIRYGK